MNPSNLPPGVTGGEAQIAGGDPVVIRPGGCKHPGVTDARVLIALDTNGRVYCGAARASGHDCGYWYPYEDREGNVVLGDEPPGAGL